MSITHRRLGRTGLQVSSIALGTMTFGLQADDDAAHAILDRAAAAGINFIDTADIYPVGDPAAVGRTEEILGRWLRGRRDDFIVATKAYGRMGPRPWDAGASRKHLLAAIDASLRRLGTDYVDLYQLHHDDLETPLDETLQALDTIVRSGRARYIGISNVLAYRLAKARGLQEVLGVAKYVAVQARYNLLFREFERELFPLAIEDGIGVVAYNPLAGGLLTGKYAKDSAPVEGTRFTLGSTAKTYQARYWKAREFNTVERLGEVARAAGVPLITLAIAWVMAHPAVTVPLIGASRPEQLVDSLAAADFHLPADLQQQLDELTSKYRRGDATR